MTASDHAFAGLGPAPGLPAGSPPGRESPRRAPERPDQPGAARLRAHYRDGRRVAVGLALAAAIVTTWLGGSIAALTSYSWGAHSLVTAPPLAAALCWLYVGLFIIAHDCMHGSLLPRQPAANRFIGRACLLLYAGFDYDALQRAHGLHHRHAGTAQDPDFDQRLPHQPWRWYARFFMTYFAPRQVLVIALVALFLLTAGGVGYANLLAFWALPAILSSVQLFYFGTYRPHRAGLEPFADRHRARNGNAGWWTSLLTCFHFGHHHTHHQHPYVPWWGLPAARGGRREPGGAAAGKPDPALLRKVPRSQYIETGVTRPACARRCAAAVSQ